MNYDYDICIIGSGVGGAPIAYELSKAEYSVVVLEKGKSYTEADFTKDELAVTRRKIYTPKLEDEQHVINFRAGNGIVVRMVGSEHNWSFWNGSMVGGSSNLMSGFFHRMKPNDFNLKSVFGEIDGANIVDWPITYEDMEPYYEKVERVIGVSGEIVKHKFSEPRSTPDFPYKKLEENKVTKWFDQTCENLRYRSIPIPRAILSRSEGERKSCSYSNFCGSYGCSTGAKGNANVSLLKKCDATIISEAFVYKLESNNKKVTKAYYYDKNLNSHTISAKIFVVAAQAIESSRLLLNSKNRYFPNGLANNSGNVGKNLIFSAGGQGSGRFRFEDLSKKQRQELMEPGLFFNRALQEWYEFERNGIRYKGGTIDFLFEHASVISRALKELHNDDGEIIWGEELKNRIEKQITTSRVLTFEVFTDWLPTDECFVGVDDTLKDKYGAPVGVINLWSHPHSKKIADHLAKQAMKVLKEMGAQEISYQHALAPPVNLVAGGCRFGDDPKTSVLDKNCKAHELDNLYITDASFMPTGGSVPYTWTIYANSFRVADKIIDSLA